MDAANAIPEKQFETVSWFMVSVDRGVGGENQVAFVTEFVGSGER